MKLRTLGLIAVLASGFAAAQTPPAPPPDGTAPDTAQRQAHHAAMLAACDADIKNLCAGQEGHGLMHCLRSNSAQLSSGCKSALPMRHPPAGATPTPST